MCRVFSTFPCVRRRARGIKKQNTFRKYIPLHILHILHIPSKSMTYPKKDAARMNAHPAQDKRTIRCTPENAAQMQQVVKHWPELHDLVKGLQDQGVFPGLRALQITLTGPADQVAQGLSALLPQNGSKRE